MCRTPDECNGDLTPVGKDFSAVVRVHLEVLSELSVSRYPWQLLFRTPHRLAKVRWRTSKRGRRGGVIEWRDWASADEGLRDRRLVTNVGRTSADDST